MAELKAGHNNGVRDMILGVDILLVVHPMQEILHLIFCCQTVTTYLSACLAHNANSVGGLVGLRGFCFVCWFCLFLFFFKYS